MNHLVRNDLNRFGPLARRPDNRDGETDMSKSMRVLAATAVVAAGVVALAGAASALPAAGGLALQNAAPSNVESVRWGGRGFGGGAFVAGAILGGALLAPRFYGGRGYYYGGGPYYAPGPYYADPGYVDPGYADPGQYGADPTGGDPVTYCLQRFRSYDPRSRTYLGFDGYRHPCP
jgi:BA14K-like protein